MYWRCINVAHFLFTYTNMKFILDICCYNILNIIYDKIVKLIIFELHSIIQITLLKRKLFTYKSKKLALHFITFDVCSTCYIICVFFANVPLLMHNWIYKYFYKWRVFYFNTTINNEQIRKLFNWYLAYLDYKNILIKLYSQWIIFILK